MKPFKHALRKEDRDRAETAAQFSARFFSCLEKGEKLIKEALPEDKRWPSDEVKTALHAFVMGEFLTGEGMLNSASDNENVQLQKANHRLFSKRHGRALFKAIEQFCGEYKTQMNPPADTLVNALEQQLPQWVKETKGVQQGHLFN